MTKDLDLGRAYILLEIVHKTVELPEFKFIKDAAIEELRAMKPPAAPAFKSDAEDPAPIDPVNDPSGKSIESIPRSIPASSFERKPL